MGVQDSDQAVKASLIPSRSPGVPALIERDLYTDLALESIDSSPF